MVISHAISHAAWTVQGAGEACIDEALRNGCRRHDGEEPKVILEAYGRVCGYGAAIFDTPMCGIAGYFFTPDRRAAPRNMSALLAHRGPDASGRQRFCHEDGTAALFHTRLSIIDLTTGAQPMANEDRTVWVTFNGEIYNFQELRGDLEARGHCFSSNADTEVLVHGYEEWREDLPDRLCGMFAYVIWDDVNRTIVAARDRLGQKPLYYASGAWGFCFASEMHALLALMPQRPEVSLTSLLDYLCLQYIPDPQTAFKGACKLQPGQTLRYKQGVLETRCYWKLPRAPCVQDPGALEEELRERLLGAVHARLVSDVPLGAFLSGGVDSSLVVAAMQRAGVKDIKTFSIGFEESDYDESHYAALLARHLRTQHRAFVIKADIAGMLPEMIEHFGEPFADSSAVPTWYLARETRAHVKVALSGDGGDELFWGYPRYRAAAVAERFDALPAAFRSVGRFGIWGRWADSPGRTLRRSLGRMMRHMPNPAWERYLNWIGIFPSPYLERLVHPDILTAERQWYPSRYFEVRSEQMHAGNFHRDLARFDAGTYLPNDILVKVDRMSMAHGLEVRSPFLDHRLVSLAFSIPKNRHFHGFRGKRLLHAVFQGWIPGEIFRRRKMGFGVPLEHWFRGPLHAYLCEILLDPQVEQRGYFRKGVIERLVREHVTHKRDHALRLWTLLVLELWHHRFVDS